MVKIISMYVDKWKLKDILRVETLNNAIGFGENKIYIKNAMVNNLVNCKFPIEGAVQNNKHNRI